MAEGALQGRLLTSLAQRKTRCDPTLPRCLPCERSGSVCEYLDTTKGKKINRYYVIKLQDKVRALEAELAQYTDDENDYPRTTEDMVRPGGMIRVRASDETSRYLGPSSGIAMTRLLMEEAKKYTDSHRIADLIPGVRAESQARMQSIQMSGTPSGRKKSYPMMSELAADGLPSRPMVEKLVELFNQKCKYNRPCDKENYSRLATLIADHGLNVRPNLLARLARNGLQTAARRSLRRQRGSLQELCAAHGHRHQPANV